MPKEITSFEDFVVTDYICPICLSKLVSCKSDTDRGLWCMASKCNNEGANDGAHGKNDSEAYEMFRAKMGMDKKK
jgi:hypothetical protein